MHKVNIRGGLPPRTQPGVLCNTDNTRSTSEVFFNTDNTMSTSEVFCNTEKNKVSIGGVLQHRGNKVSIRGIMQHTKQGQHQRCLAALANKVTIRSVQQQ